MSVIIRQPLEEEDELIYEIFQSGLPGVDETSQDEYWDWWDEDCEEVDIPELWRVAELDGKVVGISINRINIELRIGLIWEISILPEARGKGVGSKLLHESEKVLISQEFVDKIALGVKLTNTDAIKLYERKGYVPQYQVFCYKGEPNVRKYLPLDVRKPTLKDVDSIYALHPQAYWNAKTNSELAEEIDEGHGKVIIHNHRIIAYIVIYPDDFDIQSCYTDLYYHKQYIDIIMDTIMELIRTDYVKIWVEEKHIELVEYLEKNNFKIEDREYFMIKQ
ncbi:MAG: GNAT family N-acetyltransferase [Candidatus Heimdallarchaeota archaeon]|nr:GNAT family N-acetyltransferase [Candidatus Heimdallarchaeota archaeon]